MGNLGIVASGHRNVDLLSVLDVKFWWDTNDTARYDAGIQQASYGSSFTSADLVLNGDTTTVNGITVWDASNYDSFSVYGGTTGPGEATFCGAITTLDPSSGHCLFYADTYDYSALVTVNLSGVHYLAVATAYSSGSGGYLRRSSVTLDTNVHAITLRVNGADTCLYVDGTLAPWADSGYDTDGTTVDWSTGMAANIVPAGGTSQGSVWEEGTWDASAGYFDEVYPAPGGNFVIPDSGWFRHFGITGLLTDYERVALHQQLRREL